jgi:hypothetical protein
MTEIFTRWKQKSNTEPIFIHTLLILVSASQDIWDQNPILASKAQARKDGSDLDHGEKFAARVGDLKYQTVMRVNDPAHFAAKQETEGTDWAI